MVNGLHLYSIALFYLSGTQSSLTLLLIHRFAHTIAHTLMAELLLTGETWGSVSQ